MKVARLLFPLVFADIAMAQPDIASIVKQSVANQIRDRREGAQWRYKQTDVTWAGEEKQVEVSEVTPLLGTPYERLASKNGSPLSAEDNKKEEKKYASALKLRQNESTNERKSRIKKYDEEWSFLEDIPDAYSFALRGEESVDGRPAWVVALTPRPGFVAKTSRGSMLKHIEGTLWIDKQDLQWAKAEAHVINSIGIGWILARVGPGAEIKLSMTRVSESVWMPHTIDVKGSARVMMVHRKNLDESVVFSDYSRMGTDAPMHVSGNRPAKAPITAGSARSN